MRGEAATSGDLELGLTGDDNRLGAPAAAMASDGVALGISSDLHENNGGKWRGGLRLRLVSPGSWHHGLP
jgi:hypothetical protein